MTVSRVSNQGKTARIWARHARDSDKWGMENTTSTESTKARDHLEGHFRMDQSDSLYNTRVQICYRNQ
jgi:hypothetical protein